MNKHIKNLLLLTIIAALLFNVAMGCKDPKNDNTDDSQIVLADFEQWAPDFQLMKVMEGFGKVSRNTDKKYVASGKASAKLQPLGYYTSNSSPYIYMPVISNLFDFDYRDFTQIEYITCSIYNAQETEVNVYIGLIFSYDGKTKQPPSKYVLKPGANSIRHKVDAPLINLSYDITQCYGIYFGFDNARSRELKDAPVLYLDDVVLVKAKEPVVFMPAPLDENEICDFEKVYQENIITAMSNNSDLLPEFSVVNTLEYGIQASSGLRALRVVTKPSQVKGTTYPRIIIPAKIMNSIDYSKYSATSRIAFDVYNNSSTSKIFYPEFYTLEGGWGSAGARNMTAAPKQWTTFSITLEELNTFKGINYTRDMGQMCIAWAEYVGEEQEFFFDNFRIIP